MNRHTAPVLALTTLALASMPPPAFGQYSYQVLYPFKGSNDGNGPTGTPLLNGGSLYGVTVAGGGSGCGGNGCGTVFELTPKANGLWAEHLLYEFTDEKDAPAFPEGNVVQDAAGNLYGFAKSDYCCFGGTFGLTPEPGEWELDMIYTEGSSPGLLIDQAGDLYGYFGQGKYHGGAIAELSPGPDGWTYTDLYDICPPPNYCGEGQLPRAPLTWDTHGNLYGTMLMGGNGPPYCNGSGGCGVAFQLAHNPDGTWTYNVLHRFAATKTDGYSPYAGLTVDASGTAYGLTAYGGKYGNGTFFKLTPTLSGPWAETILYQFPDCANGCVPAFTLVSDKAGNLYGSAAGGLDCNGISCGVIFKLSPQKDGAWKYSVLHKFTGNDGAYPYGVVLDDKGNLFGTTNAGGKYNYGTVFELTP
jgi:uncharacterized repeat protein (TIGR03803 family)